MQRHRDEAYDPPPSLWEYVTSRVPTSEHEEIQRILGFELVHQNQVLHDEARALVCIWRQVRENSTSSTIDALLSPATNGLSRAPSNILQEPPLIRELVTNEVRFLGENLAMLMNYGSSIEAILKTGDEILSKHDRRILAHVVRTTEPMTAKLLKLGQVVVVDGRGSSSSDVGRRTNQSRLPDIADRPASARSRACSRDGTKASVPASELNRRRLDPEMSSVIDMLSVFNVDNAVERLRDALAEEKRLLLQDIDFLHNCILEEHDHQSQQQHEEQAARKVAHDFAGDSSPSIRNLQAVAASLQRVYNERSTRACAAAKKTYHRSTPALGKGSILSKLQPLGG